MVKETKSRTTHGHSKTAEYRAWGAMQGRCYNKNYKGYHNYGARGISVCDRWREGFQYFLEDMGYRPPDKTSLGRIDNERGYSPDNCRWEDRDQQDNNRRNNRTITSDGVTLTYAQWERRNGLTEGIITKRIYCGCAPKRAIRALREKSK